MNLRTDTVDVSDLLDLGFLEVGTCLGAVRKALERVFPGFPLGALPLSDEPPGYDPPFKFWERVRMIELLGDVLLSEIEGRLHAYVLVDPRNRLLFSAGKNRGAYMIHAPAAERDPSATIVGRYRLRHKWRVPA